MNHDYYPDAYIREILGTTSSVAVVGASANSVRPSYFVVKYLVSKGYDVFPVNPGQGGKKIAGALCYKNLSDIPKPVHMIDIFRNSEAVLDIVKEALSLQPLPKVIWMQLTVRNDRAAELAEKEGIKVVMNRCPKIEYARLSGEIGWAGVNSGVISSRRPKLQKGFQRFRV